MIQQAFFQRDPLSPPFHINLMLGLRFLQASLLVLSHQCSTVSACTLPIRFEEASRVKKPGRKAHAEEWKQYHVAVRQHNLSQQFTAMAQELRKALDLSGDVLETLLLACDPHKFTPEQVRKDESIPWEETKIFYGGKRCRARYKLLSDLYRQGGAKKRILRLLVVAHIRSSSCPLGLSHGGRAYSNRRHAGTA
jgi:hypothetical protein